MFRTPRKSRKRPRVVTGLTPKSGKFTPKHLTPKKKTCYKWCDEEKQDLSNHVRSYDKPDWQECADFINSIYNNNRTAKTCRQVYSKLTDIFPQQPEQTLEAPQSFVPQYVQTDLSFDPRADVRFTICNGFDVQSTSVSPIRRNVTPIFTPPSTSAASNHGMNHYAEFHNDLSPQKSVETTMDRQPSLRDLLLGSPIRAKTNPAKQVHDPVESTPMVIRTKSAATRSLNSVLNDFPAKDTEYEATFSSLNDIPLPGLRSMPDPTEEPSSLYTDHDYTTSVYETLPELDLLKQQSLATFPKPTGHSLVVYSDHSYSVSDIPPDLGFSSPQAHSPDSYVVGKDNEQRNLAASSQELQQADDIQEETTEMANYKHDSKTAATQQNVPVSPQNDCSEQISQGPEDTHVTLDLSPCPRIPTQSEPDITKEVVQVKSPTECLPREHMYSKVNKIPKRKPKKRKIRKRVSKEGSVVAQEILGYLCKENASLSSLESKKIRNYVNYTGNTKLIAATVLSIPRLKAELLNQLCKSMGDRPKLMTKRLHGKISALMAKSRENLENFKTSNVVSEMLSQFPELLLLLVHLMLPDDSIYCQEKIEQLIPKLSMIYSIIMQTRHRDLSAMQRVVSLFLMDNVVDQKVFDRLNPLGVCLSHEGTTLVVKTIGGHFKEDLVNAVKQGKVFRLCGDNLNFAIGVKDERIDKHKHLCHWFVSMALIYDPLFVTHPSIPQIPLDALTPDDVSIHSLFKCFNLQRL